MAALHGMRRAGRCSPLPLRCSRVWGNLCEGRARADRKKKPHSFFCEKKPPEMSSMQELIVPESFSKGWRFWVLLPVGAVGTDAGAVRTPLKSFSRY